MQKLSTGVLLVALTATLAAQSAAIEDELALVTDVAGVDPRNFRPDRNAAAGGALPKVAGTTR